MYSFKPLLISLASTPTTSFYEQGVMKVIATECEEHSLTLKPDPIGNLLLHYKNGQPKASFAFVSHMDHPGLESKAQQTARPACTKPRCSAACLCRNHGSAAKRK